MRAACGPKPIRLIGASACRWPRRIETAHPHPYHPSSPSPSTRQIDLVLVHQPFDPLRELLPPSSNRPLNRPLLTSRTDKVLISASVSRGQAPTSAHHPDTRIATVSFSAIRATRKPSQQAHAPRPAQMIRRQEAARRRDTRERPGAAPHGQEAAVRQAALS